jgi:glycolate dehydrogenase FAD-binding subunit
MIDLVKKLERIVGSENLLYSQEGFSDFAIDRKVPKLIAHPSSPDEISEILRVANEGGYSICPRSQGTKIEIGNIPKSVDIVLLMSRFGRTIEHDYANLTVTVEAGMKLTELQKLLEDKGQFLPIDPMFGTMCSIGGIISTNSSGPRRLRYGSVRDLLIGMKAVLPTGEAVKAGGKVVKNVAGYDMCKLFIGSFGTLGVISEATFKIYPLPELEKTVLVSLDKYAQTLELASCILNSMILPSSLCVLNPYTLEVLSNDHGILFREDLSCMAIRLEGFRESVEREISEIQKMSSRGIRILESSEQNEFWMALSDFSYLSQSNFRFKATFPVSATSDAFKNFDESSENLGFRINLISQVGSGIIYGFLWTEETDKLIEFIDQSNFYVVKSGGYFVVESAPVTIKEKINVWGHLPGGVDIMRRIKEKFDPNGIINPGRLL